MKKIAIAPNSTTESGMRVFMYQSGLAPKILTGEKTTTIRAFTVLKNGKTGGGAKCKPGDVLSHREWTGAARRSKQRELCRTICKETATIAIGITGQVTIYQILPQETCEIVAKRDGFATYADLLAYFRKTHGLPFYGEIIRWDPPPKIVPSKRLV